MGGLDFGHDASLDVGHDAAVDAGGHAHVHSDGGVDGPSLFNIPTIMAFLTWFGGAGYIFTRTIGLGAFLTVPLALLSGLFGGGIMFLVLARVLWPMMSKPMDRADFRLPGTPARVVSSIRSGGVGEIVYTKSGSRFTAGARSVGEEPVPKGAEVVILRYDKGLAYVQPVDELLNLDDEADAGSEVDLQVSPAERS
jgi:membrane protein implicated in regulation of membrane protease activity